MFGPMPSRSAMIVKHPRQLPSRRFFATSGSVPGPLVRILTLALAALLSAFAPVPALGAILHWDQTEVSLDAPPFAESVEGAFTFTNTTKQTVTIAEIHSSCGCTVPQLEKRAYAPGESGTIRAVFTLGERTGLQEKAITVTTAEPDASRTVLTLRVHIPKLFEVSPYFLIWNGGDSPAGKTIHLNILEPKFLAIESVDSSHANFTATTAPVPGDATRHVITNTAKSTDQEVNGAIVLTLKAADGPSRVVTLYALVRSPPAARPSTPAAAVTPR